MPLKDYPAPVDGLTVTLDNGVLRLRLDRPERRNAITDGIVLALCEIIDVAGSDDGVRVIHLSGTGDHFCSGFDLTQRGPVADKPRTGATQRQLRWHVNRLIPSMLECQTPIVASVRGWAIGLGLDLALASDFVVAAEDARFWSPFTGIGFTPDSGNSWLLPRMIGVARAKSMIMLGRKVTGLQAAQWGLIHDAVPAGSVDEVTEALIAELGAAATVAVGLAKLLVHRSLSTDLHRHLAEEGLAIELASRSDDFKEAGRAAKDKRPPEFHGR
jgi:2-(1,2-epoxy-1,2-dihydrophenyl)acetyl-CoA isomerase